MAAERFHARLRFLSVTKEVLSLLSNRHRAIKCIAENNVEFPVSEIVAHLAGRFSKYFPIH